MEKIELKNLNYKFMNGEIYDDEYTTEFNSRKCKIIYIKDQHIFECIEFLGIEWNIYEYQLFTENNEYILDDMCEEIEYAIISFLDVIKNADIKKYCVEYLYPIMCDMLNYGIPKPKSSKKYI